MPTYSSPDSSRVALRQQLRAARRALSAAERSAASLQAAANLLSHPWYQQARSVALYYPVGSEADTSVLFSAAMHDGKRIYLPTILHRGGRLLFVRFGLDTRLARRRHGIPQPRPAASRDVASSRRLDLVVVPLLGFDSHCHRLGSGSGYYDRSFAFRRFTGLARPRLVGLAFACQQTRTFKPDHWDVPLDAVVTEEGWIHRGNETP
jgi:5-formyltetrahydrofolate cyclo-ligase